MEPKTQEMPVDPATLAGREDYQQTTPRPVDVEGQRRSLQPGFWGLFRDKFQQNKSFAAGSNLGDWYNRNVAPGEKITVAEANKQYGLKLPGDPNQQINKAFAEDQQKKVAAMQTSAWLNSDNPNEGMGIELLSTLGAVATDPVELGINVGLAYANPALAAARVLGTTARAVPAATKLAQVAGVVAKNPVARRVAEDAIAGAISSSATYASANYVQDESVYGPEGYGAKQAVIDTVAGAVFAEGLHQLGRGAKALTGKTVAVSKKTLAKAIDPVKQKIEMQAAAMQGREPNLANMVDANRIKVAAETTQEVLSTKIQQLSDVSPRIDTTPEAPKPTYQAVSFENEPIIPKGGLKTRTVVDGKRFISPVPEDTVVSSQFGLRKSPKKGASTSHKGIDFALPEGTPFRASRGGKVIFAGKQKGYGNIIIVDHGDGFTTRYAHAKEGSITLKKGATVKEGQVIGQVGSTGNSTGPHLHFEVRKGKEAVDPKQWLKKGTQLEPSPAERPLRPDSIPDEVIARGSQIDEAVANATDVPTLSRNVVGEIETTLDDVVNAMIDPDLAPSVHVEIIHGLGETLDSVSTYTGIPIDSDKIISAISRGEAQVKAFVDAIDGKAPQDVEELVRSMWQVLTKEVKENTSTGRQFFTKLDNFQIKRSPENLAKWTAYQETVAEKLPQLFAVHKVLDAIQPGVVTRELPARVFLDMYGGNLTDFGKALVGEVTDAGNMPLYRLRDTLWKKLGREAKDLTDVIAKAKEKGGLHTGLIDPDEEYASTLVKQVDEVLSRGKGTSTDAVVRDAITLTEARFDAFMKSGLFSEESVASKQKFLANVTAALEEGRSLVGLTPEQLNEQSATRIFNEQVYTENLEKIKDILTTCAMKGYTNG